jgi:hypothetical protein
MMTRQGVESGLATKTVVVEPDPAEGAEVGAPIAVVEVAVEGTDVPDPELAQAVAAHAARAIAAMRTVMFDVVI